MLATHNDCQTCIHKAVCRLCDDYKAATEGLNSIEYALPHAIHATGQHARLAYKNDEHFAVTIECLAYLPEKARNYDVTTSYVSQPGTVIE